ncbi:hypothetical protein [Bacillus sp. ISL-39]|uniref:hypothetical protein n=1 Tax=Bacillus sp. ISL-39 TaxID=2819124 RepID=UPI001BE77FF9|nr:hypothetical protein [Bacillus sp. ISL-39]MBT2640450.1 hypothetical protein [Bacillus sp. ISL-39]
MEYYTNRTSKDLTKSKLDQYWPGFEMVAYAFFDRSHVYLFNHPKFNRARKKLKWDEQFMGCTHILYEEYPTAIVDLELFEDYESLFSILVHELFHGYQYLKGEKRFPNEILGITYPLSIENISLRNLERFSLYHALLENDPQKEQQFLSTFIFLRDERVSKIKEYHLYETLIETVEGPAWYVEFKAFMEKSPLEYETVLKKYGESLLNQYESTSHIRRSCYSSGLFMCLLLDEFSPGWKVDFLEREDSLYDFFKKTAGNINTEPQHHMEVSLDTDAAINFTLESRRNEFITFEEQAGFPLTIEGEVTAVSFDPMNIVFMEDTLLHKNFLKVKMGNQHFLMHQPVMTQFKDRIQNITKLRLVLKEKPVENMDSLTVEGVGEIKGRYIKEGESYHLFVN